MKLILKYLYKLSGVLMGTFLLGMGVAFYKISSLGQDSLSAMVFSILAVTKKLSYMWWYIIINFLFLILMIIFDRQNIHLGTIINLSLTGVFSDLFVKWFNYLHLNDNIWWLKLIYGMLGLIIVSIGIALYGSANFGIAPYDALPNILTKRFKKLSYKTSRIIIDLCCTCVALIMGVIILKKSDIIGINTILNFLLMGPLITAFSKFFNRYLYHEEKQVFK